MGIEEHSGVGLCRGQSMGFRVSGNGDRTRRHCLIITKAILTFSQRVQDKTLGSEAMKQELSHILCSWEWCHQYQDHQSWISKGRRNAQLPFQSAGLCSFYAEYDSSKIMKRMDLDDAVHGGWTTIVQGSTAKEEAQIWRRKNKTQRNLQRKKCGGSNSV